MDRTISDPRVLTISSRVTATMIQWEDGRLHGESVLGFALRVHIFNVWAVSEAVERCPPPRKTARTVGFPTERGARGNRSSFPIARNGIPPSPHLPTRAEHLLSTPGRLPSSRAFPTAGSQSLRGVPRVVACVLCRQSRLWRYVSVLAKADTSSRRCDQR